MKKYIFNVFVLTFLAHFSCYSQISRELLIADYLYNHYAFSEAIEHYEKVTSEVNDAITLGKLGDCYRLTKNPEKAADWYKEAYKKAGCPDYVKLHYGQTLMTLANYEEALPVFREYQKNNPQDRRVANMIISCEKNGKIGNDMPDGTLYFQKFNTDGLEFGPAVRNGQLIFTTDTVLSGTADRTDKWTGSSFYQMYKVDCEDDGHCDHEIKKVSNKVNTKYHDGPCSFTGDGSKMYFTRTNHKTQLLSNGPVADNNDVVHLQIMVASDYDIDKQDYKKIKHFNYNSHSHSTAHPAISSDGNWLVFVSDAPGGEGGTDLYITSIDCKGKWSKPRNLGIILNTEGDEMFPFLDGDSVLYFASNGHIGYGGLDIYKSKWNSLTKSFSEPVNLGKPVNSPYDDMSYVVGDNANAYFASNRPDKKKGDNIYSFHKGNVMLSLKVIDAVTGDPIPSSVVNLNSPLDDRTLNTNASGIVSSQLYPNDQYTASVNKAGYDPAKIDFSTFSTQGNMKIEKVIKLTPNSKIQYHVVILDDKTKMPIDNPMLVFIENEGVRTDSIALRTGEAYTSSLQPNKSYHVYGIKNNYYSNERFISTKSIKTTVSSTMIYDTIYMTKLQVGGIYKIDNIYYDYNKATIRESAKPALERLLDVLAQNPGMHIQLNSHTDCRGSDSYNFKLSNERAHSVVMYLIEKGVSIDRLQYKGYGEGTPVNNCGCEQCTEEQHQDNRRTEFQITSL